MHVGCSGWVYKHWRGLFYPEGLPQKRWFEHYSQEFDTVEINASFYRVPLASTFDGWRQKAPPGFRYAVKVNRFITHMKKLMDCEEEVDRFIALARPLGENLGPLLYQLPPSLHKNLERLETFRGAACRQISIMSSSSGIAAGTRKTSWPSSIATELGSSRMTSRDSNRRAGRAGGRLTFATTAPRANIMGVTPTRH